MIPAARRGGSWQEKKVAASRKVTVAATEFARGGVRDFDLDKAEQMVRQAAKTGAGGHAPLGQG
jgi:hypothetical protein